MFVHLQENIPTDRIKVSHWTTSFSFPDGALHSGWRNPPLLPWCIGSGLHWVEESVVSHVLLEMVPGPLIGRLAYQVQLTGFRPERGCGVLGNGWSKQPHLAESDWTLGLGGAAHLCIDQSVCNRFNQPSAYTLMHGHCNVCPASKQPMTGALQCGSVCKRSEVSMLCVEQQLM